MKSAVLFFTFTSASTTRHQSNKRDSTFHPPQASMLKTEPVNQKRGEGRGSGNPEICFSQPSRRVPGDTKSPLQLPISAPWGGYRSELQNNKANPLKCSRTFQKRKAEPVPQQTHILKQKEHTKPQQPSTTQYFTPTPPKMS